MSLRFLTIFFAIAIPLLASGQMRDRDPDLDGAKKLHEDMQQSNFHYGRFYLWSRFRISDAGFADAGSAPTGDLADGLSLSIEAPQRLFYAPRKKTIFTFDFVPGYSFFNSGEEGQINYSARADAHFLWNHLYLDVYAARADRLRSHVADINRLATVREDEVGVAGEIKYSSRTSGIISVRHRNSSYPGDRHQPDLPIDPVTGFNPINLLDRNERTARVSIDHKTFPLTSLFVSAEVSDYSFDLAPYKDSRRTWYGGGFNYDSGRTGLRVEAGPLKLSFDDPAQRSYSGLGASFNVSRSNGRWTYTAGGNHDLGFSIFANNNYYISDTVYGGINYVASRRLSLRTNAVWEQDEYDVEVAGNDRRDTILFTSVGFTYGLRRTQAGVDVGWYDRQSTIGSETDSGIRYVLHLSFVP
ncbi:MAG: hypothetical protein M3P06_04675 [Acidobacteriota bacterium]|nr:hypothetical protein [Acidobacteriota bacterium]